MQSENIYFLFSGILYFFLALAISSAFAGLNLSSQASGVTIMFSGFKCGRYFKKSVLVWAEMAKQV